MSQVFALTWTLGGGIVALQLAVFDHALAAEGPLWGISLAALATGLASFVFGPRIPRGLFAPGMFLAVAATSLGIVLAGSGRLSAAFLLFYVWTAIFAFLFFRLSTAIVVGASAVAGYVTATASIGTASLASPITLLATIAVVGVVIDGLHRSRSSSEVDVVTGAANAAGLERRLDAALADAVGGGDDLAVAILDLDGFSRVNATLGHAAGDRFLAHLADVWGAELTDRDLLARLRGDRFVVLLLGRTKAEAVEAADRLRAATPRSVGCSVGIALPEAGDSTAMTLRRADAALYAAKAAGGNRVVADGDDRAAVRELATAIDRRELVLMTQPIVDARTGRIRGFEALVRWQHPQRGMLGPAEFIPLAEHTGLIVPLGMAVLDEACRHARRWLDDFPDETLTIAVNVSGHQLADAGFVGAVTSALDRHGLPADRLVIEVTETVLADDLGPWRERVAELRELGVGISMDDFGTGYSSLGQLRELPFGTIKIDRAFVSDLPDSTEADALIAAVVGMAGGLGKKTVAEGVETVEQLIRLRHHGCDEVQGYLLGRPAPIADADAIIRQQDTSQRLIRAVAAAEQVPRGRRSGDRTLASGVEDATSLEEVVRPLLRHLLAVGDVDSAYLTSIDWDALAQLILFSENVGDLQIAEGVGIAWADTVCRRALEEGVSHTPDALERFPDSPAAHDLGIRAYATEPVVLPDGTAFGTLCVASRCEGDVPEDLRSLLAVYSRLIAERIATVSPTLARTDARAG